MARNNQLWGQDAYRRFDVHIYDYLIRRGYYYAANGLMSEAGIPYQENQRSGTMLIDLGIVMDDLYVLVETIRSEPDRSHCNYRVNQLLGRLSRVNFPATFQGLSVRPWADLFPELLEQIMELMSHVDLLHSRTVCKAWHSVVMENHNRLPYRLPMCHCLSGKLSLPLLLRSSSREGLDSVEFLCLSYKKAYGEFLLPELRNKRIEGFSKGWLVTLGIQDDAIHLLNPLIRTQILLPRVPSFSWFSRGQSLGEEYPFEYVCNAILSSDPTISSSNCIVIAIVSHLGMLSFCRLGEDKWINIENSGIRMDDVIYYNGNFYATNGRGEVFSIEDIGSIAKFKVMAPVPEDVEGRGDPSRYYLVESCGGELLLVSRREEDWEEDEIYIKITVGFDVFKLELNCLHVESAPTYTWVRVESLDEDMIFLGNGSSLCIPSNLYPRCKGNCIYFTDDDLDRQIGNIVRVLEGEDLAEKVYRDNGIYDLANGSIVSLDTDDSCSHLPPVWLTPNPWR